jgi:manganese/zinc/iron transport system permease protein
MEYSEVIDVLLLRDYNTRLVVICTMLLGCACGLMGGFLLLSKRSLMGDTLSHATLPGVGIAFMVSVALGMEGKSLPILLLGAALSGIVGCLAVLFIRNHSRIKDDAAMGIVLSVFFGAGVAVLSIIQEIPAGSAAGLESFIYGKTASMVKEDFQVLIAVTVSVILLSILFFKEFRLLCFDESFAAAQGWPVRRLDVLLLGLVTLVTVAGLQAVGLILIIAFLITPAAAARFWSERLDNMLILSALIGALSGWLGSSLSAFFPKMPAGALIVLMAAGCFLCSMLFGGARGVLVRYVRQERLKRKVGRQHLLRALYEIIEADADRPQDVGIQSVAFRQVRGRRTWTDAQLKRCIRQAYHDGLIREKEGEAITLTDAGFQHAAKVTRNHRLWEIYLIEYADVATSRVDRDADTVEHILGERMVATLEAKLMQLREASSPGVPPSPHPIRPGD